MSDPDKNPDRELAELLQELAQLRRDYDSVRIENQQLKLLLKKLHPPPSKPRTR